MKDEFQIHPVKHGGEVGNRCHLIKLSEMQSSRISGRKHSDSEERLIRVVTEFNSPPRLGTEFFSIGRAPRTT